MMKLRQIMPEFVGEIPRELDPGKLYICCRYRAVKHLCACGCGVAINTPLHPTAWTLICDGVSVSLWPSVGNWSEKCQSHYWIRNSKVHWAPKWSRRKIRRTRKARDLELKEYFGPHVDRKTDYSGSTRDRIWPTLPRWLIRLCGRIMSHN